MASYQCNHCEKVLTSKRCFTQHRLRSACGRLEDALLDTAGQGAIAALDAHASLHNPLRLAQEQQLAVEAEEHRRLATNADTAEQQRNVSEDALIAQSEQDLSAVQPMEVSSCFNDVTVIDFQLNETSGGSARRGKRS
jgi:hypothetical protein